MPASADKADTPAMRQYKRFKEQHPGCVLFFRMGDFYEMFYEDAELAHRTLGVTLTQRTQGIPMAGVPYHSVETYLRRMIQAGHRVAVCEQVEDAALAKGVVKRDVTRVVTPGTLTDEALLEESAQNPLAAVVFLGGGGGGGGGEDGERAALAWAELSTGSFRMCSVGVEELAGEVARIGPRELIYCETATAEPPPRVRSLLDAANCSGVGRPAWQFRHKEAVEALRTQFRVAKLTGLGIDENDPALPAAGAVLHYLLETQPGAKGADVGEDDATRPLSHLRPPQPLQRTDHLIIDENSLRSLEVDRTLRTGEVRGSLLGLFLHAPASRGLAPVTAMGKRLLRQWLCYPLRSRDAIEARQRVVQSICDESRFLDELRAALDLVQDVPRIAGRLGVGRATPRDLGALGRSAGAVRELERALSQRESTAAYHDRLVPLVDPLCELATQLGEACVDSPPAHMREGGLFRDGYDAALDEARSLQSDSHDWLARYQKRLIETSDLPSLKVGFNKVFGYYIELTRTHRDKAPADWVRKQTLKNAERFITDELKEFEGKVLTAESRAITREAELFDRLTRSAAGRVEALHAFADAAAELDVLASFAARAARHGYVRPELVDDPVLRVRDGRHPVLDELLGDRFVPNDVELGEGAKVESQSSKDEIRTNDSDPTLDVRPATLALITGPNMAGKSTYIRQAALITLLAHTGSFVPAAAARVGLTDRIFTRIGASDELHAGQSTFMVEMTETANLCRHATPRSLVILDEIGRGTSTLDGLSLAWAIAEHLAARGCRTLFATHYHELTSLAGQVASVMNLHVTVREWQDEIVFLHRIVPGASDRSYGVHVARLAGVPPEVVRRADEVLSQLAVSHDATTAAPAESKTFDESARTSKPRRPAPPPPELPLFAAADHPALAELRDLELGDLTPVQALETLQRLQERAQH